MDDGSGGLAWVIGRAHALGLRKPSTSSDGSEPSAPAPAEQSSLVVSHRDAHRQLVHSAQVKLATRTGDHSGRALRQRVRLLARSQHTLQTLLVHKGTLVSRLQQPYEGGWLPLERHWHSTFMQLLHTAARDTAHLPAVERRLALWQQPRQLPFAACEWRERMTPVRAAVAGCLNAAAQLPRAPTM